MEEFKRVINKKTIIFFLLCLMLNVGLFVHMQLGESSFEDFSKTNLLYKQMLSEYQNIEIDEALVNIQDKLNDTNESREVKAELYNTRILVQKKMQYLSEYHDGVQRTIEAAENIRRKSLFSDKNSYLYKNTLKTEDDYKRVENVDVRLCDDRVVDSFLNYSADKFIIFAIMVFIILQFCSERENGMAPLIHSAAKGRTILALKKGGILAVSLFCVEFFLMLFNFVTASVLYGSNSLMKPIQTISAYKDFTHPWNQLQYILFVFLVTYICLLACAIFVWMLYTIIIHKNLVTFLMAFILGAEYVLYQKIDIHGQLRILKKANIINIFNVNDLCRTYENLNFITFIPSTLSVIISIGLFISVVTGVSVCIIYAHRQTYRGEGLIVKMADKASLGYQMILSKVSIVFKELHKLLFTGKGCLIILGAAMLMIYCGYITYRPFTAYENEQIELYRTSGGQDYSAIKSDIENRVSEVTVTTARQKEAQSSYQNGDISVDEYMKIYEENQYALNQYQKMAVIDKQIRYVDSIKEKYEIEAWLMLDTGYSFIFGPSAYNRELVMVIINVVAIFLIMINCMAIEKSNGMSFLLRASVNGRRWLEKRKAIVCCATAFLIEILMIVVELCWLGGTYGFDYLDAPLYSLSFMNENVVKILGGFTIAGAFFLYGIFKVLICEVVTVVSIIFSKISFKRKTDATIPVIVIIIAVTWLIMMLIYKMFFK